MLKEQFLALLACANWQSSQIVPVCYELDKCEVQRLKARIWPLLSCIKEVSKPPGENPRAPVNADVLLSPVGYTLCKGKQILWAELRLGKGKQPCLEQKKQVCVHGREKRGRQIRFLSFIIQDCMYKVTSLPNISITVSSQPHLQLISPGLENSSDSTVQTLHRNHGGRTALPSSPPQAAQTKKCKGNFVLQEP